MAKNRSLISWILLAVVILVGFFVVRSIWASLKDTKAALDEQKQKNAELAKRDSLMTAFVDSLDQVIAELRQKEQELAAERDRLDRSLQQLRQEFARTKARIDTLWEASSVIHELDQAFPHWQGQFREAMRADGVHALLAPRFFGADAAETKAKLEHSEEALANRDSVVAVLDSTLAVKLQEVTALEMKADTIRTNYDNLKEEYAILEKKYTDLLKRKWFTLRFTPGTIIGTGAGFAAGYLVGKR